MTTATTVKNNYNNDCIAAVSHICLGETNMFQQIHVLFFSDINKKGKGKGSGGKFQPLVAGEDEDSDNDNLVVDENPKRQKRVLEPSSASTLKPGSLKLKLSCKLVLLNVLILKLMLVLLPKILPI